MRRHRAPFVETATDTAGRARAIAANNIVNAGIRVAAVLAIGVAIARGASVPAVLCGVGMKEVLPVPLLRRLNR